MQKLMFLTFLISMNLNALEWVKISPLSHCEQFFIEFSEQNGKYIVRYQKYPNSDFIVSSKPLTNINDLGLLTDELVEAADNFCPFDLEVEHNTEIECGHIDHDEKPFSDDYALFVEDIIEIIDESGNNCDDVIPLIALQEEISQLDSKDLITFDKYSSTLKIFVGDDTEKIIDHFYECGGKKGSDKFIENLILLESKKACVFPAPPGLLTLDEAKKTAKRIAKEYPNNGIMSLGMNQGKMTKHAIVEFTNDILKKNAKLVFGPEYNADQFIQNLDIYKNLKNVKSSRVLDYASYIMSLDAPLEIIDKGIPQLARSNFGKMLPESMSQKDKDLFVDENITPIIKDNYNSCIADFKKKVGYPNTFKGKDPEKKLIKYRKKLQKSFCKKNPHVCNQNICGEGPNFASHDPDLKDMEQIQACLFAGLTKSAKPLLHKIIADQKKTFASHFEMNDEMINGITDDAYADLYQCADQKFKQQANLNYREGFTENVEALQHTNADDYLKVLKQCALGVEENLTGVFASLLMGSIDPVNKSFGTNKQVSIYGHKIDQGAKDFANKAIEESLPACVARQKEIAKRNNDLAPSAINCRVALEIEASSNLISKLISDTFKQYKVDPKSGAKVTSKFEACSQNAKEDSYEALFNKRHPSPIYDAKDAERFLSERNNYYECVTDMVANTAEGISDKFVYDLLAENKDQLKSYDKIKKLKEPVIKLTKACFREKMEELGSWTKFMDFNNEDGLTKLQEDCTNKATEYMLPKIMLYETKAQLESIAKTNVVSDKDNELITEHLLDQLKEKYDISVPFLTREPKDEYVLKEAFKRFREQNGPDADMNNFINDVIDTAKSKTVAVIKFNIIDEIEEVADPGYDFSELKHIITPQCIERYLDQNDDQIKKLTKLIESHAPKTDKDVDLRTLFINYLKKGLQRSLYKGRYIELTKNLKDLCKNPKKYKDLENIAKLGIADDLLISIIKEKVIESFNNVSKNQCYDDLKSHNIKLPEKVQTQLCEDHSYSSTRVMDIRNLLMKYVTDPDLRVKAELILQKKIQSDKLVNTKFEDSYFMDDLLYKDKAVLNYIYTNFDKVVANVPKTVEDLNVLIVERIFADKSKSSFAKEFVENQLVSTIGLGNYDMAKEKVKDKLNGLSLTLKAVDFVTAKGIQRHTHEGLRKKWTHSSLKRYLDLRSAPDEKVEGLIEQVFKKAVVAELKQSTTEKEKTQNMKELTEYVTNFVATNNNHPNPKYKEGKTITIRGAEYEVPPQGDKMHGFEGRLATDIEEYVIRELTSL